MIDHAHSSGKRRRTRGLAALSALGLLAGGAARMKRA